MTRFIHSIDNDQALSGVVVEVLCMTPATGVGFAVPSGRRTQEQLSWGYIVKQLSAYGGCLGSQRR